ncbi:MAG: hypothetical protein AAF432_09275 [Planctomycetota bacterium]
MSTSPSDVTNYGDNLVRHFESLHDHHKLADDAYSYRVIHFSPNDTTQTVELPCCVLTLVGEHDEPIQVERGDEQLTIRPNEVATITGEPFIVRGTNATLLLASVSEPSDPINDTMTVVERSSCTFVDKPWGSETWLNGRHPDFAFKRIVIRAGHRTSLQYHEMKRETNLLVSGSAALHYRHTDTPIDDVTADDTTTAQCDAPTVIDVWPHTLHRIEALTDITLYEVSTPHLDDVIRVSDDAGRADGLIASEHNAPSAVATS